MNSGPPDDEPGLMGARPGGPPRLTEDEFGVLYRRLRSRAAWAAGDRGALDAVTASRVVAATREVRTSRTVTLAAPVDTLPGPDNPEPARHRMTGPGRRTPRRGSTSRGTASRRTCTATPTATSTPSAT